MPKISVIVPVYNVEKYLSACLDSILAQTFTDWEAICVNGGSPDNCEAILKKYAKKDKRIKVMTQQNQGLSIARNNGIKNATGKYVYFLDSDDTIHPQLLEICSYFAEKKNADMVSFAFQRYVFGEQLSPPIYDIDTIPYKETKAPLFFQQKRHKWKISINAWSKFYKREFIQDIPFIPHINFEDYPHTYCVLAHHPKTVLLNIPLYFYTFNPNSITNKEFSVQKIKDYHTGLTSIYDTYRKSLRTERKFVLREIFPNILKQQLNQIQRSPTAQQKELYQSFAIELRDLNTKKCISFWANKFSRWLIYRKLIKKGEI